jgi:hypothetical protein
MAIIIDEHLSAIPPVFGPPAGGPHTVVLRQTLHSDLGGEAATITYSFDNGQNVFFQTPQGQVSQIQVNVNIPGQATRREDRVTLVLAAGGPAMAEIDINQRIQGTNNAVLDGVALAVQR